MGDTVYGWVTLEEAETYMASRLGAEKYWHTGVSKTAALTTAYNQLNACGWFDFPTDISTNMKNAQCEQALFLLIHQEDMDVRLGLQAQGVSAAGIVQETYGKEIEGIPISPHAKQMLEDYEDADKSAFQVKEISRDDDEDVI